MGSLPNLNELDRQRVERRDFEKERGIARERARVREFSRLEHNSASLSRADKDRIPIFIHQTQIPKHNQHHRHSLTSRKVLRTRSSGATHHLWDDPMIEHMAAYSPISSRSHRTAIAPLPFHLQQQSSLPQQPQHFSTSSYSRRRESINSSIGATSVRRLLTVNRGCRHKLPVHVRAKIIKNFILLIIGHGLSCAVLIPILGLQGSNSIWFREEKWLHVGPDIGSVLLSISFLITSGMCLLTTRLIKKLGFIILFIINYSGLCLFLSAHLYPSIYTLLPGYIIFGLVLGPAWISKLTLVVSLALKLNCHQHGEGYMGSAIDNFDDHKNVCGRDESIRRLARWFHAAQDIGIIVGAIITAIVLTCYSPTPSVTMTTATTTSFDYTSLSATPSAINVDKMKLSSNDDATLTPIINHTNVYQTENGKSTISTITASTVETMTSNDETTTTTTKMLSSSSSSFTSMTNTTTMSSITTPAAKFSKTTEIKYLHYQDSMEGAINQQRAEKYIDEMFDKNEHGERICGVHSCPVWDVTISFNANTSLSLNDFHLISNLSATELMGIFVGFGVISLVLACFMGNIESGIRSESIRGLTDTLMFAGPMAYFIGTEQGYMLADFTKAYVSCSLGSQMVAGALIGMGIMQLIASCTLSMLLRHTKRIVVIAAGFFFHACLLLVLSRWKPSKDDSALFYVIAAAWGVCNAVWETLTYALVTLTHTNNVVDVISPLQSLRFLGLGITFGVHGLLCEGPKILILTVLFVISVPPYALLEIRLESQRKNHMTNI